MPAIKKPSASRKIRTETHDTSDQGLFEQRLSSGRGGFSHPQVLRPFTLVQGASKSGFEPAPAAVVRIDEPLANIRQACSAEKRNGTDSAATDVDVSRARI